MRNRGIQLIIDFLKDYKVALKKAYPIEKRKGDRHKALIAQRDDIIFELKDRLEMFIHKNN